jgi:hypothetical protein
MFVLVVRVLVEDELFSAAVAAVVVVMVVITFERRQDKDLFSFDRAKVFDFFRS